MVDVERREAIKKTAVGGGVVLAGGLGALTWLDHQVKKDNELDPRRQTAQIQAHLRDHDWGYTVLDTDTFAVTYAREETAPAGGDRYRYRVDVDLGAEAFDLCGDAYDTTDIALKLEDDIDDILAHVHDRVHPYNAARQEGFEDGIAGYTIAVHDATGSAELSLDARTDHRLMGGSDYDPDWTNEDGENNLARESEVHQYIRTHLTRTCGGDHGG